MTVIKIFHLGFPFLEKKLRVFTPLITTLHGINFIFFLFNRNEELLYFLYAPLAILVLYHTQMYTCTHTQARPVKLE